MAARKRDAAQRLDDVPDQLRTEIGATLRATLAPEVVVEAEALADQANFVAHIRQNAAPTLSRLAREV